MVQKPKKKQLVFINIFDGTSGHPLEASISVEGMVYKKVVEEKGKSSYSFEMEPYKNLKVSCVRNGYMFTSTKVKGSSDAEVKVDMKMHPIKAGENVVLEDIRFVGDGEQVLRQSEGALWLLLGFMQANPEVKIEVQGHVNGPTFSKNKKEFIELSTARAKTVHDFLVVNDIDPSRVTYKGFGNAHMLFPDPKNKEESEANRRVEIKVVGM